LDLFEFNGTEFISIANGFSFGVWKFKLYVQNPPAPLC
jgi:hypothetical protein